MRRGRRYDPGHLHRRTPRLLKETQSEQTILKCAMHSNRSSFQLGSKPAGAHVAGAPRLYGLPLGLSRVPGRVS